MKVIEKILLLGLLIIFQNCSANSIIKEASLTELELRLTKMINDIRVSKGLDELEENIILDNLAYEHCRQMKKRERASHFDYEYRSRVVSQLFEKRKYNENVAYIWAYDRHIEQVIDVWLKSKNHAENIYGDYELTGVAIDRDDIGGFYITQIFVND